MARTRGVWALLLMAVGLVWIGQGLGLIRGQGSFMVDDIRWAWIGAGLVLGGLAVWVGPRLRRPRD